jgi:hypothetical protein
MQLLFAGLDDRLSTGLVIWAFPLAFFVHDLEEIFTMERFVRENKEFEMAYSFCEQADY